MRTPLRGKRLLKAASRRREKAGKPLMIVGDGELRRACLLFLFVLVSGTMRDLPQYSCRPCIRRGGTGLF